MVQEKFTERNVHFPLSAAFDVRLQVKSLGLYAFLWCHQPYVLETFSMKQSLNTVLAVRKIFLICSLF